MKIALAGTGAMGVIHAKALAKIDGVEIVSIASRTQESGQKFAEELFATCMKSGGDMDRILGRRS